MRTYLTALALITALAFAVLVLRRTADLMQPPDLPGLPDPAPSRPIAPPPAPRPDAATECLDEVNAARAAKGLPPFIGDERLTEAAERAARYRAQFGIEGHTRDDFDFLPEGARADAAGCAAWPPSWGWGACATFDRYRYAGAAWATGRNGLRYMHLFVRK